MGLSNDIINIEMGTSILLKVNLLMFFSLDFFDQRYLT